MAKKLWVHSKERDKSERALPVGRRVSKTGRVYYEYRLNHADVNPKKKLAEGAEIESMLQGYAKEDIELLEKEGWISIADTRHGVLNGKYENGVFTFRVVDVYKDPDRGTRDVKEKVLFSGNKEDAIQFVKNSYVVEKDNRQCGGFYKEGGILPDFNATVSFWDLFTK